MGTIASQFATAFRDFVTDGVSSSGPQDVIKEEVRAIGPMIESAISSAALGALVDVIKDTRANLNADLAHAANSVALVYADTTDANNDLYIKVGGSGSGSWTLTSALHDVIANLSEPYRKRAANSVPFGTWSALAAATGMVVGDRATVLAGDTGTHTDPVVGGTVGNAGFYQYSASPAGWQRVADLDSVVAGAARDGAEIAEAGALAAVEAAELAAASAGDQSYWGSVMFPFENGRSLDSRKNGQFRVNGFRTIAAGTNSAGDYWRGAYGCYGFVDIHGQRMNGQNFFPFIFGNSNSVTTNRTTGMRYWPWASPTSAKRGRFDFWVRGESGPGTWTFESPSIPETVRGPFFFRCFNDGTDAFYHICDIPTRTWYYGTAAAKPASWNGVSSQPLTNDLFIGSANSSFPVDNAQSPQSASQFRGSLGEMIFCNAVLSEAQCMAIIDGAGMVATAIAAGATNHVHIPLTENGKLSTTIASTFSGITLSLLGTVWPGATMRRQGVTNWITIAPYNTPEHFPVEHGSLEARARLLGNVGAQTGSLLYRVVRRGGTVWQDWRPAQIPLVSGAFDGTVMFSEFERLGQIQLAMSSDMSVIAATAMNCQTGPVIDGKGQSELVFALTQGATSQGTPNSVGSLPENAETVVIATYGTTTALQSLRLAQDVLGWLGEGAAALVNYIRSRTQRSFLIIGDAISGTSPLSQLSDGDSARNWSDYEGLLSTMRTRGPRGEFPLAGRVIYGWEADISPTNPMEAAYVPMLQGTGSGSPYSASLRIPQEDIDHFYNDGTTSLNAKTVIVSCNRVTGGGSTTDASSEADTRDHMRNYAHILGYEIAPENTAHKMQGENAAGGLPAGAVTHPETNDLEGSAETALAFGEACLQAAGIGSYPGAVFFKSIRAGTATNKVIVKVGDPDPYPGMGLAQGATGYRFGDPTAAPFHAIRLHTKKNGGDAGACFEARLKPAGGSFGAWAKTNVVSGIILSPREVELTLAWTLAAGDEVQIRYLPGGPGAYSSETITQANWRAGVLYFSGKEYASGEPNTIDDLMRLGWQVCGSNQALAFVAA